MSYSRGPTLFGGNANKPVGRPLRKETVPTANLLRTASENPFIRKSLPEISTLSFYNLIVAIKKHTSSIPAYEKLLSNFGNDPDKCKMYRGVISFLKALKAAIEKQNSTDWPNSLGDAFSEGLQPSATTNMPPSIRAFYTRMTAFCELFLGIQASSKDRKAQQETGQPKTVYYVLIHLADEKPDQRATKTLDMLFGKDTTGNVRVNTSSGGKKFSKDKQTVIAWMKERGNNKESGTLKFGCLVVALARSSDNPSALIFSRDDIRSVITGIPTTYDKEATSTVPDIGRRY